MKRHKIFLYVISIGLMFFVSRFQQSPGYMDAEYYHATGQQLARGHSFSEPFVWNYLNDPQGVPQPSHAYWMPLPSLVAALGIKISNLSNFTGGRLVFIFLAGLIAPLTTNLAFKQTAKKNTSIMAGILALVPVFYLPFLPTTDTFALYMVFGAIIFLILSHEDPGPASALSLGLIVGLMHLSRADGLVWLPLACVAVLYLGSPRLPFTKHFFNVGLIILGYLLVMAPWFLRNINTFGSLLSPGGTKALWFTSYNELFAYPSEMLNPSRWWSTGVSEIIRVRLWALGQNMQSFVAVQGAIFLTPLILVGAWHRRRDKLVQVGIFTWLTTLAVMSIAFPFAGARGGFFHSGAAYQPLLWVLAVIGLEVFLEWGHRVRGWSLPQSRLVFSTAIVGMALGLSLFILNGRVISAGAWDRSYHEYQDLEKELQAFDASLQDLVLVNNPPGYYLASGRMAFAIPDGDVQTLLSVAQRYQVRYVILEFNHPDGLDDLFDNPLSNSRLELLWSNDDAHIFQVLE